MRNRLSSIAPLREAARKTIYGAKKRKFIRKSRDIEVDDKMVVFCSFDGRSYSDSPKAVYEYMVNSAEYGDWKFVWIFNEPEKYKGLMKGDTLTVKRGTGTCDEYLARAKYWILNFRAFDSWTPKEEQVYVQCWHGTPLKKLGYDLEKSDNAMNTIKEIREKYRSDAKRFKYLVSPCRFDTEVFATAWNLPDDEKIIETGYPRDDVLVNGGRPDLKALDIPGGKKVILYAPTWRDNQYDASVGYTYESPVDFDYLREKLGDDYVILFRAHYLVANSFSFDEYEGFIYDVSDYDDINDLYLASDLLITDYSSVFFDYALLEKPVVFYMYDMEEYESELRGFYISPDELPGPVVRDEEALVREIISPAEADYAGFNEKYNTFNDGKASERLVKRITK